MESNPSGGDAREGHLHPDNVIDDFDMEHTMDQRVENGTRLDNTIGMGSEAGSGHADERYPAPGPDVRHVPYEKKWAILQPVLRRLYLDENIQISDIVQIMIKESGFYGTNAQYKYQFKKWNWKKNVPKGKKEVICKKLQTRASAGRLSTTRHHGRAVDERKLRRYLKDESRELAQRVTARLSNDIFDREEFSLNALFFGNTTFLSWSLPYEAMRVAGPRSQRLVVPSDPSPTTYTTPSDVSIMTPSSNHHMSPINAPSPMTVAQSNRAAIERTNMFISGQYLALAKSLSDEENRTLTDWRYHFWFYNFKSAKCWGRGPHQWTWDILDNNPDRIRSQLMASASPVSDYAESSNKDDRRISKTSQRRTNVASLPRPPVLCRWSVHLDDDVFEAQVDELPHEDEDDEDENCDPGDEKTWRPWSQARIDTPFEKTILHGLEENTFSPPGDRKLPIQLDRLVEASNGSKIAVIQEALGFAIMGRNTDLVQRLTNELTRHLHDTQTKIDKFFPLHLAASYLDGSKVCCNIIHILVSSRLRSCMQSVKNDLGHSVLDALMLRILSSHTSIGLGEIDDGLRGEKHVPGEEVDICGRWDADSEVYLSMLATGTSSIPQQWKHKFCHTSAQAICHSIVALNYFGGLHLLGTESRLFFKLCTLCGTQMTLSPLHTFVVVCFKLLQHGQEDEDLLGMIAVLMALLNSGQDPLLKCQVSPVLLFGGLIEAASDPRVCLHSLMSPYELMKTIPVDLLHRWSKHKQTACAVIARILKAAETVFQDRREGDLRGFKVEGDYCQCLQCSSDATLGSAWNGKLQQLWEAIQAELLTYRRQTELDPWISPNLDLDAVHASLLHSDGFSAGAISERALLKPSCENCGTISYMPNSRASELSATYFSNLGDNWELMTPIAQPCFE